MGNALAARLLKSLKAQQVRIRPNAALQELTVEDGRVTGAVVTIDGKPQRITARRGVILATGGFGGSAVRLNEYVKPPLADAVAFAGAQGDGMRIARAAGAAVEDDHESAGVLDAGVANRLAQGRPRRLPASRARPLQARADRGQRRGPPLRRRGGVVSRLRSRHAPLARNGADHSGVARLRPRVPRTNTASAAFRPAARASAGPIRNGYLVEARPLEALARRSTSMRRASARASRATTATPRPARTATSARARPSSTATTAIRGTGPIPASDRSRRRPTMRWRSIRARSAAASGCKADADGRVLDAQRRADPGPVRLRQRHGVDHARHLSRSRASRSDRRWCSPIAPRWPWPARVLEFDPLKLKRRRSCLCRSCLGVRTPAKTPRTLALNSGARAGPPFLFFRPSQKEGWSAERRRGVCGTPRPAVRRPVARQDSGTRRL